MDTRQLIFRSLFLLIAASVINDIIRQAYIFLKRGKTNRFANKKENIQLIISILLSFSGIAFYCYLVNIHTNCSTN